MLIQGGQAFHTKGQASFSHEAPDLKKTLKPRAEKKRPKKKRSSRFQMPIFRPKSSEVKKEKKVITSAEDQF